MQMEENNIEHEQSKSEVQADICYSKSAPISANVNVIGLVNALIGGTCLVLPHVGLRTGWAMSILVCIFTSWISYYTASLLVLHLGKGTQIKDCILNHFNNDYRYMTGYSFYIWFSFMPFMLIYFKIICLQIQGLMGHHSDFTGPLVAIGLVIVIIFIRIYHVREKTLAYGIISIIGYLVFLIWAHFTAPEGPKTVQAFGKPVNLTSTLIMAETMHDFIVANITKNPNRNEYHSTVRRTFFAGTIIYSFICLGSFAIVNRTPFKQHPQTINDFFRAGEWQNSLIEVIYMIHMVTAYPNFLIISKVRFFQMFKIEIKHRIDWHQAVYIVIVVLAGYLVYILEFHLQIMISLDGVLVSFIYILIVIVGIHLKCVFYDRTSGYIENDPEWNNRIVQNACECDIVYKNKFMLYLQTIFLIFVVLLGLGLIYSTISNVANGTYHS